MMSSRESLWIALGALRAHPMRSLLTMLGIIFGIAAVIITLGVGAGAQARVEEQIRSLGANLLLVQPGAARNGAVRLAIGTHYTLTEGDAAAIATQISDVVIAAPSVPGAKQVVHGNRNWNTVVNGTWPDYLIAREWPMKTGRSFSAQETQTAAKVAILGNSVAKVLFATANPIGAIIRIAKVPFRVVGVLAVKGTSGGKDADDVIFVPISTAKLRLFGSANPIKFGSVKYILVKFSDAAAMPIVEKEIEGLLRDRHRLSQRTPDDFRVVSPAVALEAQHKAARTLSFLLAAIASVSMIVGGVSIMNIMLVSVTERTREIGLRLALGARRRDIRRQFLAEAVALSLVGGIAGIVLGIAGAALLAKLAGWTVLISVEAIIAAAVFAAAVGIFFGYYPAARASRLDPIEALRVE
jgi:putative ABC transport system permease protein